MATPVVGNAPVKQEAEQIRTSYRLLLVIVLVALAIRLAIIPFGSHSFENLMDADHIHAWEQGNVARALVAGQGFGSPFQSTQPSAVMPPVYPLIVAAVFRVFGVH